MWDEDVVVMTLVQEAFGQTPLALGKMRLQGRLRLPPGYRPLAVLVMPDTVQLEMKHSESSHLPFMTSSLLRDWLASNEIPAHYLYLLKTESGRLA